MRYLTLVLVLLSSLATPAAADPPAGKVIRLGFLSAFMEQFDPAHDSLQGALIEGLREHGYQLGRNLSVEFRSAQGQPGRLPALAAELARLNVDVLVTPATPALAAAGAT